MEALHPFGSHFKSWRERRGYSLKEAAGDIVSPQFLSQFENGKKSITIDKFSRLLLSIGVDWRDYIADYPGEQLSYAQLLFYQLRSKSTGLFNWGKFEEQLQEELDDRYQDNPFQKEIFFKWLRLSVNKLSNQDLEQLNLTKFVNHIINRQEAPNMYEGQLLLLIAPIMPLEYQFDYAKLVCRQFKTACLKTDHARAFRELTAATYLAESFIQQGLYDRAQDLIDKARAIGNLDPLMANFLLVKLFYLDMTEICLWLKQNKPEAVPRTRKLLEICDHMIQFFPNNNWQLTKQDLVHTFNQYNKTGKLLYGE